MRGTLDISHLSLGEAGAPEKDQVEDYARRKGWDVRTAERWLAPILNYEPA